MTQTLFDVCRFLMNLVAVNLVTCTLQIPLLLLDSLLPGMLTLAHIAHYNNCKVIKIKKFRIPLDLYLSVLASFS